uniref:Alternative protein SMCR7 n=1 Tax=Homo sapiens TaxID=9606 RepID=L8E954_HUMAN|nr:alternative protein SMCR7 [Homo sapiens]
MCVSWCHWCWSRACGAWCRAWTLWRGTLAAGPCAGRSLSSAPVGAAPGTASWSGATSPPASCWSYSARRWLLLSTGRPLAAFSGA